MFLTRECDYGIRVIRSLADGSKKTVESVATLEHIPKKYAYKIVKKLEKGGLLESIRGRAGGYRLSRATNKFTLLDVVHAVDPNRYVNDCIKGDTECPFKSDNQRPCAVHKELMHLQSMIEAELSSKSMDYILGEEAYVSV